MFFKFNMTSHLINRVINFLFHSLNKITNFYFTFHARPKFSEDLALNFINNKKIENKKTLIAIVMQGPLIIRDNFTRETLNLYTKFFPNYKLILSTWKHSDQASVEFIKKLGVEIILNDYPKNSGISNINLQIVSTSAGIKKAKEIGCKYVLKTRTDQRIYSKQSISLCYSFIKQFPLSKKYNQDERIVSFNLNTFKFRPYGISDMINFGNINDMIKYWCIELDPRLKTDEIAKDTLIDWAKQRYGEVYFVTSFLNNINRKIHWTLDDSWQVMSENFCILNINEIDLYWIKYTNKEFRHQDYKLTKFQQFNFSDWFILQSNISNIPAEDFINEQLSILDNKKY